MDYDSFVGEVQHRLDLSSGGEAVRATRGVLTTLGERLGPGEAADFAGPLPMEIDRFLHEAESGQQFSYDEFVDRVGERAEVGESDAAFYAKAVVSLACSMAPESEVRDVREQLPDEFADLFELTGAETAPW